MKTHTTNYINTLIEIAEDSPVSSAEAPKTKSTTTIANIQFDMISKNPYRYTSDDVIFETYALKNHISESEKEAERLKFFSKGQPCMRCSPLPKKNGFGIHNNAEGKIALVAAESEDYQKFVQDENVKKVKAMRSKKLN